jgi:hypothetical protein
MSGFWGRWPTAFLRVPEQVFRPLGGSWLFVPVVAALSWIGSTRVQIRAFNQVVAPFLIILAAFYILFNIPSYYWYYGPFLFFATMYLAALIPSTRTAYIFAILFTLGFTEASAAYLRHSAKEATDYRDMARWITNHSSPDIKVATVETGTIGWYCDRYIIDIVGLTTPSNAHYTAKGDFSSWFQAKPDLIIVHPANPFPWEKIALQSDEYQLQPTHFGSVWLLKKKASPALMTSQVNDSSHTLTPKVPPDRDRAVPVHSSRNTPE